MRRRALLTRALPLAAMSLLPGGRAPAAAGRAESTVEKNKDLIRRVIDRAFNHGDLDIVAEVLADDYLDHAAGPGAPRGLEGFRGFVVAFRATLPDVVVTVEDLVAEGDRVALRVTWRGTQLGPLGSVPATGLPVEFVGYHVYRVEDGKLTEHWGLQDDLGLLLQLGVIASQAVPPTPGVATRV
ncbi:MAG: ester cyclase [Chloroflexota bacterium]|nr:ester cyclase [Chloroflexota bacterium]MDP9469470.1 ester cyclase [Chloroflexota bacterium]